MNRKSTLDRLASLNMLQAKTRRLAAAALALVLTSPVFAATPAAGGSGMPWEGPLNLIVTSAQGPVARAFILLAIITTGLGMAFGEHGSGFKKVMGIAFGGSIVIGALAFVATLFGATF